MRAVKRAIATASRARAAVCARLAERAPQRLVDLEHVSHRTAATREPACNLRELEVYRRDGGLGSDDRARPRPRRRGEEDRRATEL